MKPSISIKQVWSDNDLIEFEITTSDGSSAFCNRVYAGHHELLGLIKDLGIFRNHLNGGIYNVAFGQFGPEYASGAFAARLHFYKESRLAITVRVESEWREFKKGEVASNATLYLMSEPVLLDNFIDALKELNAGTSSEATLWAASL